MKVRTILDQIDLGSMALPEFQRGYVWNRDQVRGLMDSLYRKHPVGSLLVWVTKTEEAVARGDAELAPGSVKLLLDGQQRVTSLYGIVRGDPAPRQAWLSEIAEELVPSVRTVERHIGNIYGKISARGRADATAYTLTRGLISVRRTTALIGGPTVAPAL